MPHFTQDAEEGDPVSGLYVPLEHMTHADMEDCPLNGLYFPGRHFVHAETLLRPKVAPHVPIGQEAHASPWVVFPVAMP